MIGVFSGSVFGQKARLFDEFGFNYCDHLLSRIDGLYSELQENPKAIGYIVYYEGEHAVPFFNKKTGKNELKFVNPRLGEGLNEARSITLHLTKYRKLPKNRFKLISGGYDYQYRVEFWLVPKGAKPPKSTASLEAKDIKFRKGKLPPVNDCQGNFNKFP